VATVLVVDDEPDIRELVRINLELDGHRVLTAEDGAAALELVRDDPPDIVLLDVMMPGIDGWQVLGDIKGESDAAVSHIPVLMLTARADELDRLRGAIEGAIRYITKPFALNDLRMEVRAALEGDSEAVKRRRAQTDALEELARIERGDRSVLAGEAVPRPHLTRLERTPAANAPAPRMPAVEEARIDALSEKQLDLLKAVAGTGTVRAASEELGVSRSNVYASLRRIARKLGVRTVPDLVNLARRGELFSGDGTAHE
jgi:DNA-binding response OmpR family regulator/DNA-binding CsgD family transcriptional regulator